jgi:hypothetical protein
MKKLFKISVLLGLTVLLWTCNEEEFLNTPPQGALAASNLTAREGIDAALISAYSRVDGWAADWGQGGSWGKAGSNWLFGSVVSDDTHKGSEPADGVEMQQIELFQWRPANGELQGKFLSVFDGIRRANETLTLINGNEALEDAVRNRLTGEALFLRAHFHADAYKIWKNVPYFDETETEFRKPNDQDILPLIVADFERAADLLDETAPDIGRATSGAANAMLGRLHMIAGNMPAAKTALDKVENSNQYELQDCFHEIFSIAGENGSEMIFTVQATVNDGDPNGDNANFSDRLANPHGGSPIGCCGFHQPTQNLVNAYRVDGAGLPLLDNSSNSNPTADEPVDPRLDWTTGRDGVPYLNWGTHAASWIRDRGYSSEYSPKKLAEAQGESSNVGWVANQLSPINVPLIRYADVILMLAEIDVENNMLEAARTKVNRVRTRAGNCAQGADNIPVPLDDPTTSHATYAVGTYDDAWTDQGAAREAVRLERRLELAMEGHRFFDLVRYGESYMISTMNAYMAVEETRRPFLQGRDPIGSKHTLFPIPTQAIQLSNVDGNPTMRQNPGY